MAVADASPRPDSSASHKAISSAPSGLASDDPTRRSSVRPRSEIEASKSEKKALLLMAGRGESGSGEKPTWNFGERATKSNGDPAQKTVRKKVVMPRESGASSNRRCLLDYSLSRVMTVRSN